MWLSLFSISRTSGIKMLTITNLSTECLIFFFNLTATTEIYTLSLHDALPILEFGRSGRIYRREDSLTVPPQPIDARSEEHTSELQSLRHLVCRLLLEKKNSTYQKHI